MRGSPRIHRGRRAEVPVKLLRYGRRNLQACVMMAWLPLIVLGLVVSGVVTALMREPGVRLYDWIATRAPAAMAVRIRPSGNLSPTPSANR